MERGRPRCREPVVRLLLPLKVPETLSSVLPVAPLKLPATIYFHSILHFASKLLNRGPWRSRTLYR